MFIIKKISAISNYLSLTMIYKYTQTKVATIGPNRVIKIFAKEMKFTL